MTQRDRHDVIVVGGGPAGSTAAALLARQGFDVVLLEKEKFPREHVGESLLPFCYSLFDNLGLVDKLKDKFVRKPGVRFLDRHGNVSTTWCFQHVIPNETYLSFQVARGEFDTILLDNARRLGAKVFEETAVKDADVTTDPDGVTVESLDAAGNERVHHAKFLVDASGRDCLVGTKNGWRKPRAELDRTAVWSHWTGVKMAGGLEEGMSIIVYMGEEQKGWIWVFPLGPDRITAGVVAQNSYIREQRRLLQEKGSTDWKYDYTMQELERCPFVKDLLQGTQLAMPMQVNGNYSYEVTNHYGSNYAMVGDARGFIDPIFSSGVFLSMKSAHLLADAVGKKLREATPGVTPELTEVYRQITGAYGFVHRMIRLFYNPHAVTWAEVGADLAIHKAHESAMAAGHFMLSGDFFENSDRYNKFLELLENPDDFARYKRTIIDRAAYREPDCKTPWETAFGQMAAALQASA